MDKDAPRHITVDENDNVIGVECRDKLKCPDNIFRSSALWITNSKGQFLLAQRALTKSTDPGMWGPAVAGTLDEGETYESNIYKEAEEEINLTGYEFQELSKVFLDAGHEKYFVQWYTCCIDEPTDFFHIAPEEVMDLKWIDKEEFLKDVKEKPHQYQLGIRNYSDMVRI